MDPSTPNKAYFFGQAEALFNQAQIIQSDAGEKLDIIGFLSKGSSSMSRKRGYMVQMGGVTDKPWYSLFEQRSCGSVSQTPTRHWASSSRSSSNNRPTSSLSWARYVNLSRPAVLLLHSKTRSDVDGPVPLPRARLESSTPSETPPTPSPSSSTSSLKSPTASRILESESDCAIGCSTRSSKLKRPGVGRSSSTRTTGLPSYCWDSKG